MSDLVEISANFSQFLVSVSPQVKEGCLQWYLSGSLATMTMASAENITEIQLDEENNIIGETETKVITDEQSEKIRKFSRKLGNDIDVVNVNGNLFGDAQVGNKPHIQNVKNNVPDVLDLMSWSNNIGGSGYIDCLDDERKISKHPVARIKTQKGEVFVTAPPEQFAHKLSETIFLSNYLNRDDVPKINITKYDKDIRDLSSMFYGFKDIYGEEEFLERVYTALNEKDGALFSIYNPNYNTDNAMQVQEILEEDIMGRIIEDSANYLRSITDDNSDAKIIEFFKNLFEKRKIDVEKMTSAQLTALQQRENALALLEAEEKTISEAEALKSMQEQKEEPIVGD